MVEGIVRIIAPGVAPPGGHYAHAVAHGGQLFISGQLPIAPDGRHRIDASFADQARQAITNLLAIAEAGGSDRDHFMKVTAYIVGVDNWPTFNAVFAEIMGDARPARAIVPVPELHHGYLVEVDGVGAIPGVDVGTLTSAHSRQTRPRSGAS